MRIVKVKLILTFLLSAIIGSAQIEMDLTITGASLSTTCTDFFSTPDLWCAVTVNANPETIYDDIDGLCYETIPHLLFEESWDCINNIPSTIDLCFEVFDNDGLIGCFVNKDCPSQICQTFPMPAGPSQDYTLSLPPGSDSEGTLMFTIEYSGMPVLPVNDEMCGAVDIGIMDLGDIWGDASMGLYDNFCANFFNELNPCDFGHGNCNTNGVWFKLTSGPEPMDFIDVIVNSDPENTGNDFPIQVAVYESLDGGCMGVNYDEVSYTSEFSDFDADVSINCVNPNTEYYILIDGAGLPLFSSEGRFGIEARASEFSSAPNLVCDAMDMGMINLGDQVTLSIPQGNHCADNIDDPVNLGFNTEQTVWYSFIVPETGHVRIDATSIETDPIDLQLGLYTNDSGLCTDALNLVASTYTLEDNNESLQVNCLVSGATYWLMVDGEAGDGYFNLMISDAGFDFTTQTSILSICAGQTHSVGNNVYNVSGMYVDTLILNSGCLEEITTDLTILQSIEAQSTLIQEASQWSAEDGQYQINATGGDGNYTFTWSDGGSGSDRLDLIGGEDYCVTVTDLIGCEDMVCFTMEFIELFEVSATSSSTSCDGSADGSVSISAVGGIPPFIYTWQHTQDPASNGSGQIPDEDVINLINNLVAGEYLFTATDMVGTTAEVTIVVTEPDPVVLSLVTVGDASCFGACDGEVLIEIQGGVGQYTVTWIGTEPPSFSDLCQGDYQLTAIDANNCLGELEFSINQPNEVIISIEETTPISCLGEDDGQLQADTNIEDIDTWLWSNGVTTQNNTGLSQGDYTVTLTDINGCEVSTEYTLNGPQEELLIEIQLQNEIICFGDNNGALSSMATGPIQDLSYTWSNGETAPNIVNLEPGNYSLEVVNATNCVAQTSFDLSQPEELNADIIAEDLTCLQGDMSGVIHIFDLQGGVPPYQAGLLDDPLSADTTFNSLPAGLYDILVQDANNCQWIEQTNIFPAPNLLLDLGNDLTIKLGDSVFLDALTSGSNLSYIWNYPLDTLPSECLTGLCSSITVTPDQTTIVQLKVIDNDSHCEAIDDIKIVVDRSPAIFVPNAFSPNDDGANDFLRVFADQTVRIIHAFEVYDRYGGQIFGIGNLPAEDLSRFPWDGTFNGERVQTGVYIWRLKIEYLDGRVETLHGDVTVMP